MNFDFLVEKLRDLKIGKLSWKVVKFGNLKGFWKLQSVDPDLTSTLLARNS